MIFYLLIVIILILIFINKKEKNNEEFKIFDIKRDVLSHTNELAKYLLLNN